MGGTDFWSRRKAGVETEEKIALQIKDAEETAALQAEQAEKTDEELLLELDLPNPDDMKMGDDFSAFMSKAVPDRLRRRALRRLWLANPALANLDGLLDYGEIGRASSCEDQAHCLRSVLIIEYGRSGD